MHACKKTSWSLIPGLCLLALAGAAMAAFSVNKISARLEDRALRIEGSLDLGLSDKVEEALSKGIPLEVRVGVRLYRERPWLWDEQLEQWVLRHRILYHALSNQYLVNRGPEQAQAESFTSLQEALAYMGTLDGWRLPLESTPELEADAAYRVEIRASLSVESLPAPLRPVAYTSPSWHLNSGWTSWKVLP